MYMFGNCKDNQHIVGSCRSFTKLAILLYEIEIKIPAYIQQKTSSQNTGLKY